MVVKERSLSKLSNELLLTSIKRAKKLKLDKDFIQMLEKEAEKRKILKTPAV